MNQPNKKDRIKSCDQAGFTLIEVLASVLILSITLVATFFILTANYQNANFIKESYVASNLAQEGVEVVRNIRDNDWHAGLAFGASIPDGVYRVQWNSSSLLPLGANPPLKRDSVSGIYSYGSGSDTNFRRTVDILTILAGVEKRIIITVSWFNRGNKTLSVEEHLYNWR